MPDDIFLVLEGHKVVVATFNKEKADAFLQHEEKVDEHFNTQIDRLRAFCEKYEASNPPPAFDEKWAERKSMTDQELLLKCERVKAYRIAMQTWHDAWEAAQKDFLREIGIQPLEYARYRKGMYQNREFRIETVKVI